jgi:hypothetical protein
MHKPGFWRYGIFVSLDCRKMIAAKMAWAGLLVIGRYFNNNRQVAAIKLKSAMKKGS